MLDNDVIFVRLKRVAALAKQSLMYYGSFGITAFLCGTVFVDRSHPPPHDSWHEGSISLFRSNPQQAALKLNSISENLKEEKTKLWIFPEGTRYWGKIFEESTFFEIVNLP